MEPTMNDIHNLSTPYYVFICSLKLGQSDEDDRIFLDYYSTRIFYLMKKLYGIAIVETIVGWKNSNLMRFFDFVKGKENK